MNAIKGGCPESIEFGKYQLNIPYSKKWFPTFPTKMILSPNKGKSLLTKNIINVINEGKKYVKVLFLNIYSNIHTKLNILEL